MIVEDIRETLEKEIDNLGHYDDRELERITKHSRGHQISNATEGWVNKYLNSIDLDAKSYYYLDFVEELFNQIGRDKKEIKNVLNNVWWHSTKKLIVKKSNINEFVKGEELSSWQQSSADLILFYGDEILEDCEKVIFINVKGHDSSRSSRAPNIISGQKLMDIFKGLLETNKLEKANYWFIGVDYRIDDFAKVENIHVADLFRLDMTKIKQINFDAAIQLQWHVRNMIEKDQTRLELIKEFADEFLSAWESHTEKKTKKYKEMRDEIITLLESREYFH